MLIFTLASTSDSTCVLIRRTGNRDFLPEDGKHERGHSNWGASEGAL